MDTSQINETDKYDRAAFLIAVYEGNVEEVKKLLERDVDGAITDEYSYIALVIAAFRGHDAVIEVLHALGKIKNIDAIGDDSYTVLHMAAIKGHPKVVKKLLEYGADSTIVDEDGKTALMLSALYGDASVIEAFHAANQLQNINAVEEINHWTALHIAAGNGHVEVTRKLLEYGADPTLTDKEGWTALMIAVFRDHNDIIDVLHKANKLDNINARDNEGCTALMLAVRAKRIETVKKLLEYGADPTIADNLGGTPLIEALVIVEKILAKKTDSI